MERKTKAQLRLDKLVQLGLARRRDYVRGGKIDKAAQDRLRRLAAKVERGGRLRRYVQSPEYRFVRPKSEAQRRKLLALAPKELRALNLQAIPVKVGIRRERNKLVTNQIRSVRELTRGTLRVVLDNGMVEYHIPIDDPMAFVEDPDEYVAPIVERYSKRFGSSRVRYRIRWGFGGLGEASDLFDEETFAETLAQSFGKYVQDGATLEDIARSPEAVVVEVLPMRRKRRGRA